MIALVELRVDRVLPFQHTGRMRDANEELRLDVGLPRFERALEVRRRRAELLVRFALHGLGDRRVRRAARRREDELAAGILLEHVVDHLRDRRAAYRRRVDAFVAPSDGRPQRRPVRQDLPFGLEPLQRLPMLVLHQRDHARVVRLVDRDVIDAEARQRLVDGETDELRRHVLRQLTLTAGTLRIVVEVVAELGADVDVAALLQNRREHRLAAAVAVRVSGVDVVDAEVECLAHQGLPVGIAVVAPPAGGQRPGAEAELGELDVGAVQISIAHAISRGEIRYITAPRDAASRPQPGTRTSWWTAGTECRTR